MDDEPQLLRALQRRDQAAWARMYDRHVTAVFSFIFHLVARDRAAAEEINQEVWLVAIERVSQFDPARGEFRAWLLGIARHRALRRKRGPSTLDETPLDGMSDTLSPPELLEGLERADVVRAALLCLHDDRRRILLDKYADGLSVADIADKSGRTVKAVESLLSRAREQLRTLLQPYFSNKSGDSSHAPSNARLSR